MTPLWQTSTTSVGPFPGCRCLAFGLALNRNGNGQPPTGLWRWHPIPQRPFPQYTPPWRVRKARLAAAQGPSEGAPHPSGASVPRALPAPPDITSWPASLGISKRDDMYLRTLLIHGLRAVSRAAERKTHRDGWVKRRMSRRNENVAIVARASQNARNDVLTEGGLLPMAWAITM